ncbi:GNAT family N-acetyltransferase [Vibrio kagoshimensis]|uniref:GNAT family N-acetyltransferase n=1 Tax=Vibrio kagoshimensis TaxID=2910244 RepID=UPI002352891D
MNNQFVLELASEPDFDAYLSLKSEPANIYWSGFEEAPNASKLFSHFQMAINSTTRDIYLLKTTDLVVGYLYVDHLPKDKTVELAYGVSEYQSGKGLAKVMISLGLERVAAEFSTQVAWIAESNIPSIKTIQALGFESTSDIEYRALAQFTDKVKFVKFSRNNK